MGSRVDNGVRTIVVRKIRIVRMTVERELENLCAGQVELISKRAHIRCDQAQVFGDEWQTT